MIHPPVDLTHLNVYMIHSWVQLIDPPIYLLFTHLYLTHLPIRESVVTYNYTYLSRVTNLVHSPIYL